MKIKDRILLGVLAGLAGNVAKMAADEAALRMKISQRSFRSTAAGVWLRTKRDADSPMGQLLGGLLDFGFGTLGGIGIVQVLTKTGRDQLITKGIVSGIGLGSMATALVSSLPQNTVRPKDAKSNLSYMAAHGIYGVVTTIVASRLGHSSVFDSEPVNDYDPPTELTTQRRRSLPDPQFADQDR